MRNLLLVSSFCFITNLSFAQLERNVTIGGGLTTSNNIPFNGNADFGWTSMIFGNAAFHGSDLIIKIGFYVNNSPVNYTMQNQRIYMRLTAATDYTSANYPGTAGFTKVYDGPITYNGSGWAMVTLQTPFAYNNAQNLEVLCENGDGSKAAGFPVFRYTDVGANRTVRNFADVTFPTAPGTLVTARPNTKFVFPTPSNINCLTNTPATDLCSASPLISNLNGYCGNTKSTYTDSPSDPSGVAFCGNLENTSWLKFVASETTARLNIIVDNCIDNNGIQMRIYETSNCGTGTFTPKSNCWSPSFVQPGIVEATGLTPGNTYHLMIDGYAGDQCDYIIYINSGVQLALSGTYSKTDLSCPTGNDGGISVYPIGGVKPYKSFALSGSATQTNASGIFTGLAAGTYSVTITDQSNSTFVINNITLAAPAQTITVRNDTTICKDANVQLSASGATSYNWTAIPTDASLTNPVIASPTVQPTQTTVYTLNAQTSYSRNLIYNGGFELGNTGFASDYTYLSSNPSGNQKAYGIINNANNWSSFFSSSCIANGGTGNMMVVDGSTTANDTVWCQTVPVLPNTNYTFSYLLQSVGINPSARMDVLINGSPIGNFNAPGSLCNWVPVSHGWNSGIATTAKICIINRETAQFGNDFAIDDIWFTYNASCSFAKNVTVTVNNPVTPTFPTYGPLCEGTILIQPVLPTTSNNNINGTWTPAALSALTPGSFPYTFTPNTGQCATTAGFTLKVNPKVNLSSTSTPNTICNNSSCPPYSGKKVVINELHIQPSDNQVINRSNLNAGGEWIELYNPSPCDPVDLSCHMIGNYSTEAGSVFEPAVIFFPPGTTIPPLGFLTIGGNSSPASIKPGTIVNGFIGNRLYLPSGVFDGGWIGIWDANGTAIDAVYWMDATRNINSTNATASFTTSPGTITSVNVPFNCPYTGTLPTARALANSGGPITRIGNIASDSTYQFRSTDGGTTWTFNSTTSTPNACNSTCATPFTPTCNGTATVTATTGTGPFTYKWNDPLGQTTATATGLCAGKYTVTVNDANSLCTEILSITVTDNCCTTITNPTPSSDQTICSGGDPSALTVNTTATGSNAIKFVYFTTQQTTAAAIYAGTNSLGTATPIGSGAASFDPPAGSLPTNPTTPTVYVYAILSSPPASDPNCRPFAEIVVTVIANPTITLGTNPEVCLGATSASLSYTGTTGSPNQYSINFDATAEGAGFVDVVNQPLSASPIGIAVPTGAAAGTYNATMKVRNSTTGCESIVYNIFIRVNNAQPAAVSITSNATSNTICAGTSVTFTATPTNGGASPVYQWKLNGTNVGSNSSTYTTTTLDNNDEVSVEMTSNAIGCLVGPATVLSSTITMIVNSIPTISLGASPEVCRGVTSANLPYTTTTGSSNQYTIDFNTAAEGQGFVDVTNQTLVATPIVIDVPATAVANTYNATLKVRNGTTGCESVLYNFTIKVNASPTISLTPGVTSASVCAGSTLQLSGSGTPASTNAWVSSASSISTVNGGGLISGEAGGTALITYTDVNNCTATQSVIVNDIPAAPILSVANPTCSAPLAGSITVTNPSSGSGYEYSINNGGSYQSASLFSNLAINTYSLLVREIATGCVSEASTAIIQSPTFSPKPDPLTQRTYCVDQTPVEPVTASGTNLLWYTTATGGIGSSTAPIPDSKIAGQQLFYVTQRVPTNGCESERLQVMVEINPLPVVSAGPDRKVELGKTIVINGTANGSNNNILWTPPTGLSSTNTLTPVATITQTTTYTLAVTSQVGCTSTDQVLVTLLMPVDVPNVFSPNGDGIHDRWVIRNLEMYENVRVQIFNRYGTMLFERFTYNSSNAWDGNLNGNPAPVGPYYYVITYGEGKKLAGVVSIIR